MVNIKPLHQLAEVGGFIGEINERGKGYGSETLRMMCDYCFNILNIRNIYVRIFEFNCASRKSAEKVGFKLVGKINEAYYYNGVFYDELFYQISKEQFYAKWDTFVKNIK